MTDSIYEALISLGYPVHQDSGEYFRLPALYRGGKNPTSLSVHKNSGKFIDFAANVRGSWKDFLMLATNNDPKIIEKLQCSPQVVNQLQNIKYMPYKVHPNECLNKLIPFYDFYEKRGISASTQKLFEAGLATAGAMRNRIVFPIRNEKQEIIGFAGRNATNNSSYPKWLISGPKRLFCYPCHLNLSKVKKQEEVILVESIGDVLSLWESGIQNAWCLFGLAVQSQVIKNLIQINPKRIIIALNNDSESEENHGQNAAEIVAGKLMQFFNQDKILICAPTKNDFGVMNSVEIQSWYSNVRN